MLDMIYIYIYVCIRVHIYIYIYICTFAYTDTVSFRDLILWVFFNFGHQTKTIDPAVMRNGTKNRMKQFFLEPNHGLLWKKKNLCHRPLEKQQHELPIFGGSNCSWFLIYPFSLNNLLNSSSLTHPLTILGKS